VLAIIPVKLIEEAAKTPIPLSHLENKMKFYTVLFLVCVAIFGFGYYGYHTNHYGESVLFYFGAIIALLVIVALLSRSRPARL